MVKVSAKQGKQLDLNVYPEAFAFTLGSLGPNSQDRIISNMGAEKWQAASVKGEFVELVKAIDKLHLSDTGTVTKSENQRLIKAFNSIRQRKDESTADYYQWLENLIRGFEPISLQVPEDWQQASAYIAGLDNERYAHFKADTEKYAKLKIKDYPKTLADALQRAIDYVIPRVPATEDEAAEAVVGVNEGAVDEAAVIAIVSSAMNWGIWPGSVHLKARLMTLKNQSRMLWLQQLSITPSQPRANGLWFLAI